MRACVRACVRVSVRVCVSITTLAVLSLISTLELNYEQLYHGIPLFLDFASFIRARSYLLLSVVYC